MGKRGRRSTPLLASFTELRKSLEKITFTCVYEGKLEDVDSLLKNPNPHQEKWSKPPVYGKVVLFPCFDKIGDNIVVQVYFPTWPERFPKGKKGQLYMFLPINDMRPALVTDDFREAERIIRVHDAINRVCYILPNQIMPSQIPQIPWRFISSEYLPAKIDYEIYSCQDELRAPGERLLRV